MPIDEIKAMGRILQYIEDRHNPEYDAGPVTGTDMALSSAIHLLSEVVQRQESEINQLKEELKKCLSSD
jgi:hypothetical protein